MMSRAKPPEEALTKTLREPEAWPDLEGLLERLRGMRTAAGRMRPHDWLRDMTCDQLRIEVAGPLSELLREAVQLLEMLESDAECDEDAGLDQPWDSVESSSDSHLALAPGGELGNVAFTARLELSRAAASLAGATSREALIVACDRGRRKLRRCAEAVLDSAPEERVQTEPPGPQVSAVESALIVRVAYGQFREALPACDPTDPASVMRAIRISVNAVSRLLGGRAYEHIRHADRLMLRELQQRMVHWAHQPDHATGVRLHKDLMTTADLLRGINHRQELREHDERALRALARTLRSPVDVSARGELVRLLQSLRGRCDELDACIVDDPAQLDAARESGLRVVLGTFTA